MNVLRTLFRMIRHPRRTSRELQERKTILPAMSLVLTLGVVYTLCFLISHLTHSYPPPPDVLETWIETWGEFSMLPFVKIAPEVYRLSLAIISVPLTLTAWVLMAGYARLISALFRGRASYDLYLSLFGFSFFSFWILASLFDLTYSNLLESYSLNAIRGVYGPFWKSFSANFPAVEWIFVLSIGGLYNAIVTYEVERFAIWKAALIGLFTMFWPIALVTLLLR